VNAVLTRLSSGQSDEDETDKPHRIVSLSNLSCRGLLHRALSLWDEDAYRLIDKDPGLSSDLLIGCLKFEGSGNSTAGWSFVDEGGDQVSCIFTEPPTVRVIRGGTVVLTSWVYIPASTGH